MNRKKKVAIVYDWIDKWGGVERLLLTLAKMFPDADFFTSYYDHQQASWARNLKINTSFIQNLPLFIKKNRLMSFFLYPYAFESFNFSDYDLVISVSSSFSKSVVTRPETKHICILLTPTRYFWVEPDTYLKGVKKIGKLFLPKLRQWDYVAAQRPDKIVSISQEVAARTKHYYSRDSQVIYPPFDIGYWLNIKSKLKNQNLKVKPKNQKYFLVVSRLEPYKKVDLVVETFNRLPHLNLIIIGKGTQDARLKNIAGDNISFFQNLTDEELALYYRHAEALIMPQQEEFGYVALEAQVFGCPVIAYSKGGATETVLEEKTGIFFNEQSTRSIQKAIEKFIKNSSNFKKLADEFGETSAKRFSKNQFTTDFFDLIRAS